MNARRIRYPSHTYRVTKGLRIVVDLIEGQADVMSQSRELSAGLRFLTKLIEWDGSQRNGVDDPETLEDRLVQILWPDGDPDAERDAGTLDELARALEEAGLKPPSPAQVSEVEGSISKLMFGQQIPGDFDGT